MRYSELMAKQWDERAKKNVYKFIDLKNWKNEQEFNCSGFRHAKRILELYEKKDVEHLRVLDLGCGIGRIAVHIAPLAKELILTDISSEMIKIAKERLKDYKNVNYLTNNGLDLSEISDTSIDLIYSVWVFQHVPLQVFTGYLKEINRILRPEGILIFQIYEKLKIFSWIYKYWLRNLRNLNFFFWKSPPDNDTWTARSYQRKELKDILEKTGLEIIKFENPTNTEKDLWIKVNKT